MPEDFNVRVSGSDAADDSHVSAIADHGQGQLGHARKRLGAAVAPVQCDIGTFQDQKSQSGCKPCSPGGYCISKGLTAPALCPLGTFNPLRASSSITDCKACPAGKTTAKTGATASAQCNVNGSG